MQIHRNGMKVPESSTIRERQNVNKTETDALELNGGEELEERIAPNFKKVA